MIRTLGPALLLISSLSHAQPAGHDAGVASTPVAGSEKPVLVVNDLLAQDVTPAQAAALTDALAQSLASRGLFRVRTAADVRALLSQERQRTLLGACAEDSADCAVDLAETSGARFVLSGSLSRLGQTYQLSVQMLDSKKSQPVARSSRLAGSLATLQQLVPYVAAEATGSPLPPPASRVLPYSLLAAGGSSVLAGGVVGLLALNREGLLNEELCPGGPVAEVCTGQNLKPIEFYRGQNAAIGRDRTASLLLMLGGAALLSAGFYLMPPPEGGPRVAFVATGSGVGLAGVFP